MTAPVPPVSDELAAQLRAYLASEHAREHIPMALLADLDQIITEHGVAAVLAATPAAEPQAIEWGWGFDDEPGIHNSGEDERISAESGVADWRRDGYSASLRARQCGPWVRVEDGREPNFTAAAAPAVDPETDTRMTKERALLGQVVEATIEYPRDGKLAVVVRGKLLSVATSGEFALLDDDGFTSYAWPLLDVRLATAAVPAVDEPTPQPEYIPCCSHCGCTEGQRNGHDDLCQHGCNDDLYREILAEPTPGGEQQ